MAYIVLLSEDLSVLNLKKYCKMQHFIWVFIVSQGTNLGVSSIRRVTERLYNNHLRLFIDSSSTDNKLHYACADSEGCHDVLDSYCDKEMGNCVCYSGFLADLSRTYCVPGK